jgi:histidyl-tRNA synthetase
VFEPINVEPINVGSVVAGGRYDRLLWVGKKKRRYLPAIGVSFGISRLMMFATATYISEPKVFVATTKDMFDKRIVIASCLRNKGYCV